MPDYDTIFTEFATSLPKAIAKPTLSGPQELQAALNVEWGSMWAVVDRAGRVARDRYGADVFIGTTHQGYDIPEQAAKAALRFQRPGVEAFEIPIVSYLDKVEVDGQLYGRADKEHLVATLLDRIKQWLEQPLS